VVASAREEFVKEVKLQWQNLWRERIDDKVRAEGIADKDYSVLFVDKGTVVLATRDFKQLSLKEILEQHKLVNVERLIPLCPGVGGWGKFIRTTIANQQFVKRIRRAQQYEKSEKPRQQLKKGGRGWLHA
jgi:hypothetical protein